MSDTERNLHSDQSQEGATRADLDKALEQLDKLAEQLEKLKREDKPLSPEQPAKAPQPDKK